ncbi:Maf family protein [Marinobacter caseinilyticus]|uniref:Maf family protein n=1 Tax=Marinobacter caseinilyticus TaxID=2692195 RepID=UPI00140A301C|nr:Maf family protein [Marinobacter caseinilyticus]
MRPIILASASPRRADLLRQLGLTFSVFPVDIDERPTPNEAAAHYVERLAREKAFAGLKLAVDPKSLVIGSDTSVVRDGDILGKPDGKEQAAEMLASLSGRSHKVMTAVALAGEHGCFARVSTTEVRFRALSESEIRAYCDTGEPMDKAGAYGIQGRGGAFVSGLWGSYSAVVGLPLDDVAALLAEAGQPVWMVWNQSGEKLG